MSETLEMKINKNTEIVFDFYVDKILPLVEIKNKNVILIGLGNTKFIKFIKSIAKHLCKSLGVDILLVTGTKKKNIYLFEN